LIKHFGLPLTYAYITLRQSVAGNSPFRGIVFCNLGTSKTVILKFVTTVNIVTPYLSPYIWLPQQCSRWTKKGRAEKNGLSQIRLFNKKGTLFDLAGTKNSSRTDRRRKKGRFEINRFQFFSTLISIKRPQSSH